MCVKRILLLCSLALILCGCKPDKYEKNREALYNNFEKNGLLTKDKVSLSDFEESLEESYSYQVCAYYGLCEHPINGINISSIDAFRKSIFDSIEVKRQDEKMSSQKSRINDIYRVAYENGVHDGYGVGYEEGKSQTRSSNDRDIDDLFLYMNQRWDRERAERARDEADEDNVRTIKKAVRDMEWDGASDDDIDNFKENINRQRMMNGQDPIFGW